MNTIEQVTEKVKAYITDSTFGDKTKLNDTTLIFREGYFDSMGFVSLIAFLEDKFEVKTADDDLIEENFESINAIVHYVGKKIGLN